MYARTYAQIVGVVLLLVGVLGLILGEGLFLRILNIDILEDIVHLITGGILAYVGFGQADERIARNVVGTLGVIYLLVGILGFIVPMLFGLIPHGYTVFDDLLHLALGVLSLVIAFFLEGGATVRRT
jgi:preprotein translocase subunit Sss1